MRNRLQGSGEFGSGVGHGMCPLAVVGECWRDAWGGAAGERVLVSGLVNSI